MLPDEKAARGNGRPGAFAPSFDTLDSSSTLLLVNHYCAGTGHHAEARVARLCEAGLMVDCGRQPLLRPGERLYRVTAEGGAFLKLPKYLRARLGFGPPPAKP